MPFAVAKLVSVCRSKVLAKVLQIISRFSIAVYFCAAYFVADVDSDGQLTRIFRIFSRKDREL